MIEFHAENNFTLEHKKNLETWIGDTIATYKYQLGSLVYIFCDDRYLHTLNLQFLNHDTFTDIITFDNSLGKEIHGEIYISTERVAENAKSFGTTLEDELHRVMIHGVLHLCGLQDKTAEDEVKMRNAENKALASRDFM